MKRRFLTLSMVALTLPVAAQTPTEVTAQLSSQRFTVVVPYPPGGPTDSLARLISQGLSKRYTQPSVVENIPGAGGVIGMEKVKRAKGNGHTLMVIPSGNLTVDPTMRPDFPFNIALDFAPITMLATTPNLVVTSPSSGIKTIKELVAQAKAKPDSLSYASPGAGTSLHLAGELFKQQTGIQMLHVAYKGSAPALNDVLGGVVPLMFTNLPAALPFIQSGKLVALGITTSERSTVVPEVSTLSEQGVKGVNVTSWYGLVAPAGTPVAVVDQLAKDAADILAQPQTQQNLAAQGLSRIAMTPAEFARAIKDETQTWAGVIKNGHIKIE